MTIETIDTRHPLYAGELELRYRVLREPLGMGRDTVKNAYEEDALHIIAHDVGEVVGCVMLHCEAKNGRLKQMAVTPARQKTGLGRALVASLEMRARAQNLDVIILHAREHAVGFYERLGYEIYGEPFVEVQIPHRFMRKHL